MGGKASCVTRALAFPWPLRLTVPLGEVSETAGVSLTQLCIIVGSFYIWVTPFYEKETHSKGKELHGKDRRPHK